MRKPIDAKHSPSHPSAPYPLQTPNAIHLHPSPCPRQTISRGSAGRHQAPLGPRHPSNLRPWARGNHLATPPRPPCSQLARTMSTGEEPAREQTAHNPRPSHRRRPRTGVDSGRPAGRGAVNRPGPLSCRRPIQQPLPPPRPRPEQPPSTGPNPPQPQKRSGKTKNTPYTIPDTFPPKTTPHNRRHNQTNHDTSPPILDFWLD